MSEYAQEATVADLERMCEMWRTAFPIRRDPLIQQLPATVPHSYINTAFPVSVTDVYQRLLAALLHQKIPRGQRREMLQILAQAVWVEELALTVGEWSANWNHAMLLATAIERKLRAAIVGNAHDMALASKAMVALGYFLATEHEIVPLTSDGVQRRVQLMQAHNEFLTHCNTFVMVAEYVERHVIEER